MWTIAFGDHDVLLDLTLCFGRLPDPWWRLWKNRDEYFNKYGQAKQELAEVLNGLAVDLESRMLLGLRDGDGK